MILGCQFLEPFLIWVLWDDSGIQLFLCQEWHLVIGIREVIYKELCCEFFLKMRFDKASTRWADRSISSFRLGDASRSCNLIDLGRRLGIYIKEETTSPHFYAYLDSCITELPQEYGYMQVQGHTRGTCVYRTAKENVFTYPTYLLLHRLVVSTICHHEECDKVPSGNLFYMWCLTQTEVHLNLLFSLALHLSGVALGTMPLIRICGGHWFT